MAVLGDVRPIYRIVTRFRDFKLLVNDSSRRSLTATRRRHRFPRRERS